MLAAGAVVVHAFRGAASTGGETVRNQGLREYHPESICGWCGGDNPVWTAPSPLWNEVMRGGDINGRDLFSGVVCPSCFAKLASREGIADGWRLTARVVHVELKTVTPSGRVWNPDTWLWDDAVTPPERPSDAEATDG